MGELCKRTEEWRVNDEVEAKALIEKAKADENVEGYELKSYKMVKKDKKSKGEIIDEWVIVTLVKAW
jgi:hypothetical protein